MKIDLLKSFFSFYLSNISIEKNEININEIKTILIMSNTAIGDTLFATPAIRLIKQHYPSKKIIALLNPKNSQLFETNPYIDQILTYTGKWRDFFKTLRVLRKLKVDLVFIMHSNEPQASPLAYFSKSKYVIKIPNDKNEFNHLHYNQTESLELGMHFIDARLKQLQYIGITSVDYKMDLFIKSSSYNIIDERLKIGVRYIGIQVGASTKSRMYPVELWASLVEKILAYDDLITIILTGAEQDRAITNELQKKISNNRVKNFSGIYDICTAVALIDRLALLITPDTGPLHIAASVETPTIAFSVAGSSIESNPRDGLVPHIFIQKPKTCIPCIDKKCQNPYCMRQILVDEIFTEFTKIIKLYY